MRRPSTSASTRSRTSSWRRRSFPGRPSAAFAAPTTRSARRFPADDFAGIDFAPMRLVKSPDALIERLDNGACQGCHQAGSTAGFHFIGRDDKTTSPLNRIEVGVSPHFHAEQKRRAAYLAAVVDGREPSQFRPLSFAPPADWSADAPQYEPAGAGNAVRGGRTMPRTSPAIGRAARARSARRSPRRQARA